MHGPMTDELSLGDSVAIITGASAGIGKATAISMAKNGAHVALMARGEDALTQVASRVESHGTEALVLPGDVTVEDEVKHVVDQTIAELGKIDIVVNNAGVAGPSTVEHMTTDEYRHMMAVNTDGIFFMTRETIPHLRETKGQLILVGSMAGEYPRPAMPVYAATKWWTRGFGLSLSGHLGTDDIGVSVINPTEVGTDLIVDGEPMSEKVDGLQVSTPDDIANAITFAANTELPNSITELDIYRRDKLSHF